MSEATAEASDANQPKSVKDKSCIYCGQAFTSSSLGRHLDLYIRDKNPKPPDGVHDVDAIRRLRGNVTRRQPRGSTGGRREGSVPAGTPRHSSKQATPPATEGGSYNPAAIPKYGQYAVGSTVGRNSNAQRWEALGPASDVSAMPPDAAGMRPGIQRTVSKQMAQKAQLDAKQKLFDALDTARAAELALRELLSSWRAAKQQINSTSTPFSFDPLALDFPALALRCLQPPPTLFSSTQLHASNSWAISSPGQREYGALRVFFHDEFQRWKVACASSTTTVFDDMPHPASHGPNRDAREAGEEAEKRVEILEKQVTEHLAHAYAVWGNLSAQKRDEVWVLELARGIGAKHAEAEKIKEQRDKLAQENANLKIQLDQMNRSQLPQEYRILPPSNIPVDRDIVAHLCAEGVKGGRTMGFDKEDRHSDLGNVVARAIERWKNAIASTRVAYGGMYAQQPLDQPVAQMPATTGQDTPVPPPQIQQTSLAQTPQAAVQQPPPPPLCKRLSTSSVRGAPSDKAAASATATGPLSSEETSDQDADAEMEDDDSFAMMSQSPVKATPPMPQQAQLDVARTNGSMPQQQQQQQQEQQQLQQQQLQQQKQQHQQPTQQPAQQQQQQQQQPQQKQPQPLQQQPQAPPQQQQQQPQAQQRPAGDMRFMVPNGAATSANRIAAMAAMTRSMPNINMAAMQANAAMHGTDVNMAMQGVRGDMYME